MDRVCVSPKLPVTSLPDLPLELLLKIYAMLCARDICHTLTTCRALKAHYLCESIWQELASRFGVYDISQIPVKHRSFRSVYVNMLHKYRSLFGYWVSDALYWNHILHVRWQPSVSNNGVRNVIVGTLLDLETKRHRVNPFDYDPVPKSPIASVVFSISLADNSNCSLDGMQTGSQEPVPLTEMTCSFSHAPHTTSIALGGRRRILLKTSIDEPKREISPFPANNACWLNLAHSLNMEGQFLTMSREDDTPATTTVTDIEHGLNMQGHYILFQNGTKRLTTVLIIGIFLYTEEPGDRLPMQCREKGFSLTCSCYDASVFPDIPHRLSKARWFPLAGVLPLPRGLIPDMIPEAFSELSGLWLGVIPTAGIQAVFLHKATTPAGEFRLRATKVTGDMWIARGHTSWDADLSRPVELESLDEEMVSEFCAVLKRYPDQDTLPPLKLVYAGQARTGLNWNL